MRAVVVRADSNSASPDCLEVGDVPNPTMDERDVRIKVVAAGVNRADILQRQGRYPPPSGASDVLGLECSGVVVDRGSGVTRWSVGDRVCALLSGGGYAREVVVRAEQVFAVPEDMSLLNAAALPEAACTVMSNISMTAGLAPCEWILIHGGASGIGTMAIQWAKALEARVAVTVGDQQRAKFCLGMGADAAINYRESDFVAQIKDVTDGHGADVILDIVGAKYLDRNISALARNGRLVTIGLQGGVKGELNLGKLLSKQGRIAATSLRGLPAAKKAEVCANVSDLMWPLLTDARLRPVVHEVIPWDQAAVAHARIEAGGVRGKLVLQVADEPDAIAGYDAL